MNCQNWYKIQGTEMNSDRMRVNLNGVRKGAATWVAIMVVPAGS